MKSYLEGKFIIINWDNAYPSFLYYIDTERDTKEQKSYYYNAETGIVTLMGTPVDIPWDQKYFNSKSEKIKNTPIYIKVHKDYLIPVGKPQLSAYMDMFHLLPDDPKRFKTGALQLNEISKDLLRIQNEVTQSRDIAQQLRLELTKLRELREENVKMLPLNELTLLSQMIDKELSQRYNKRENESIPHKFGMMND